MVDSDRAVSSTIAGMCEQTGSFSVSTAESGEAALVWLFTNEAHVIVSGSALPGMSGIELLSSLQDHDIRVPLILFSDEDSAALMDEAYRHDAYGFIIRNDKETQPYQKLIRLMYWAAGYTE